MNPQRQSVTAARARSARRLLDAVTVGWWACSAAELADELLTHRPAAVHAQMTSDGQSLRCVGWVDAQGAVAALDEGVLAVSEVPMGVHTFGLLDWESMRLDLQGALALDRACSPLVEVLAVRDPDGPVELTVAVLGHLVDDVTEHHVDAGAGWSPGEWQDHAEQGVRCSSSVMRPYLDAAFASPPGGGYIGGGRF